MDYPIGAYLDDYSLLAQPETADLLHDLVRTYPWFTLGRYMELRALRGTDPAAYNRALRRADVRLFGHPYPGLLLDDDCTPPPDDFAYENYDTGNYQERPDTVSVIDDFLSFEGNNNGPRIVPPPVDNTYEQEDISAESVADDGEVATEMLARIYLAQGLPDRAVEIYYRLSLKYPEKSTYFANLIADVQEHYGSR